MAIVNYDTFGDSAGTILTSHTSDTGSTYTKNSAIGSSNLQISYGTTGSRQGIRTSAGGSPGVCVANTNPATADYTVSCQIQNYSNTTGDQVAVLARCSSSVDTCFGVVAIVGTGYLMFKHVVGVFTQLGSTYTTTVNDQDVLALQVSGTTITAYVNGQPQITAKDSSITAAGNGGIYIYAVSGPADNTDLQAKWFAVIDRAKQSNYLAMDGDSRVWSYYASYGAGTPCGTSMPGTLQTLLGSAWTLDNFGVPGYTFPQINTLAPARIDSVATGYLLCTAGFNDVFAPQAASQTTAQAVAILQSDFIAYWQARRSATPNKKLIASTVGLCGTGATAVPSPSYWITVLTSFNLWIRTNWQTYTDYFVDVATDARFGTGTNLNYFSSDQVHNNDAGYAAWGQDIYPIQPLSGIVNSKNSSGNAFVATGIGF
jgi:lysophospholipase L1-like esterase